MLVKKKRLGLVLLIAVLWKKISFWVSTGVYGDVHRVKIMFKKRGIALVQMADAAQAQLGIDF